MFQRACKNMDDGRRKAAGSSPALDHIQQSISVLVLNGIDAVEEQMAIKSGQRDQHNEFTIRPRFRFVSRALPEKARSGVELEPTEELA